MIVDRIIDGGYFENSGAFGAKSKELALAIRAVDPNLAPIVLIICNDPDDPVMPDDDTQREVRNGRRRCARRSIAASR